LTFFVHYSISSYKIVAVIKPKYDPQFIFISHSAVIIENFFLDKKYYTIMTKKECFNCKNTKEGNNFSVPVPNTEERANKFYC